MATINPINSSNPVQVALGGTGDTTLTTAYAPVCAGTTATGALQVASTGLSTSGYVLTSTGSSSLPTFQAAPAAGSLVKIATMTASGSPSTISFTSGIATYTTYFVTYSNVESSGTDKLQMLFSTNGGSSYLATGYLSGVNSTGYTSNTWSNLNSTTYGLLTLSSASTQLSSGSFWLFNLTTSSPPTYVGQFMNSGGIQGLCFGNNSTTSGVNAIQFSFVSGSTFNSGTFTLYGLVQ